LLQIFDSIINGSINIIKIPYCIKSDRFIYRHTGISQKFDSSDGFFFLFFSDMLRRPRVISMVASIANTGPFYPYFECSGRCLGRI
jgi:hypothetical protein